MAPKRAHSNAEEPSNKKTRFVSPPEDPQRFAEEVDDALETPASRKGRVKTDGYDSDSSDDGEGVVFSRRKEEDNDDEDMFADPDEANTKGKGKEKVKYMTLGDIEGQEFDDADTESAEDEDAAEKKRKAGMGFKLTRFNMKEEMEEGKFDADGTFVRTFDQHAVHDRWMEGTNEKEIKRARLAKKKRDQEEAERIKREQGTKKKEELELELVQLMRKGEDVLEALARLGKAKATNAKGKQQTSSPSSDSIPPPKTKIEHITELASALMTLGDTDIYSTPYEALLRSVRRSGIVPGDWTPPGPKFEYIWAPTDFSAPKPNAEIYGPFDQEQIMAWYNAQYFGQDGEKILIRTVDGPRSWGSWSEIVE